MELPEMGYLDENLCHILGLSASAKEAKDK